VVLYRILEISMLHSSILVWMKLEN
jgi:hypothetical protein